MIVHGGSPGPRDGRLGALAIHLLRSANRLRRRALGAVGVCREGESVLLLLSLRSKIRSHRLYAVSALDNVRLERNRSWSSMKLKEESARIAQDRAKLVATP